MIRRAKTDFNRRMLKSFRKATKTKQKPFYHCIIKQFKTGENEKKPNNKASDQVCKRRIPRTAPSQNPEQSFYICASSMGRRSICFNQWGRNIF